MPAGAVGPAGAHAHRQGPRGAGAGGTPQQDTQAQAREILRSYTMACVVGNVGNFFYDSMSGSLISKAGGLRIGSVCKFSLHPEECSTMYRMGQNRKKY